MSEIGNSQAVVRQIMEPNTSLGALRHLTVVKELTGDKGHARCPNIVYSLRRHLHIM